MTIPMRQHKRAAVLAALERDIALCRVCRDAPAGGEGRRLPHEPRPVCVASPSARVVICGQAPGTRVHASGRPFTDPSGNRLRDWLGVDEATFYDPARIAIVPMGFCFPGLDAKGGDLPPRRECARRWHDRLFAAMGQADLVLAIGRYAQAYHLPERRKEGLTEIVADWRAIVAETAKAGRIVIPLPHPSWRNNAWIRRHPWFEQELLPEARRLLAERL
jgi:uracil-DNA glycosylase